jgi:hypothetical protein
MQPIDNIASRPTLTMSAPSPKATSALSGSPSLPARRNDLLVQAALGEDRVDAAEAEPKRQ